MTARDTFTNTVDAAAAYEKARAQREDDYDEPDRPDPSEYADLGPAPRRAPNVSAPPGPPCPGCGVASISVVHHDGCPVAPPAAARGAA